ncbi:MAG TPA: beta-hydroxyacyl-ACP dehydratase, partial [Clostridiales bacterium]|nr:beta-hydroxyacyl-ACP dehydratase [Clostridiales bacterium]
EKLDGATPYFTGLDKVRFKSPIKPGDTLITECEIIKEKHPFVFAKGKGYVNNKLCISAEFSFAIIK